MTIVISLLRATIFVASFALALIALRHFFFTLVALILPRRPPAPAEPSTKFTVLIPAHDEESGVVQTIVSAHALDYLKSLLEVVVLADNCSDRTAQVARAAGALVVERRQPENPGKGQALAWFIASKEWNDDEALVCLDADSVAVSHYLLSLDARLRRGASLVQGYNGAKDPGDSSLAALSFLTNTMKNAGTYAGRASLGLPVPMMNGWCISGKVLREKGWSAFSVTEDFEQTLRFGLDGLFGVFAPEARVLSEKAGTFRQAASQRRRWSGGESSLSKELAIPALRESFRKKSWALAELALDVLLPGYATTAFLLVLALLAGIALGGAWAVSFAVDGLLLFACVAAVGFFKAGGGLRLAKGLLLAPVFILWKTSVAAAGRLRPPKEWQRAKRD